VVCPEAWRLKFVAGQEYEKQPAPQAALESKREWIASVDLSAALKRYAKTIYLLLVLVFIISFLLDLKMEIASLQSERTAKTTEVHTTFLEKLSDPSLSIPNEIIFLLLILGVIIFVWDFFDRTSKSLSRESGLSSDAEVVALKGSKVLPSRDYVSDKLQLASRPDGLIKQDGALIPVDRRVSSKKVRDRHIAQMMVHLLLVEENEGKRPPYGLLLLGKEEKQVRIKNTDERDRWLRSLVDEMRSILDGVPAEPAPQKFKCKHCDVRSICAHSAWRD